MELFSKFVCTNCQEDIPGIRIHCCECSDYESCLQCFSAGAEIGQHRNTHNYKFMDAGTLSIFRGKNPPGGWSAKEELLLLDSVEQYGFGNWQDISKHIETKSPEDAKEEYISKFLNGTIGRHTWGPQFENRPVLKDYTHPMDTSQITKASIVADKVPALDILPEEAQQLGYLPNREDFEIEYDAAAEKIVSNLSFTPEDDDGDLKLAQIRMYSRHLKERSRRKKLVRDYQLAAQYFRDSAGRRNKSKEAKEFRDKFRPFAQFFSSPQYERLLYSLEEERSLRNRLSELARYRNAGVSKIQDCIYWEQQTALQARAAAFQGHQKGKVTTNTDRLAFLNHLKEGNFKATLPTADEASGSSGGGGGGAKELNQLQEVAGQTRRQLLLNNEMQLCSVTSTPVTNYITLKAIMLSDPARQPSNASEKIMKNYFSKCGWLP